MDELIIRHLSGRATGDEEALLLAWRARSLENEARFAELERLWSVTGAAAPPARRPVPQVGAITGETRGAPGTGTARDVVPGRLRTRFGRKRAGVAAAMAAMIALVSVIGVLRSGGDAPADPPFELVTGAGEMASAQLPDGTVVRLGPESRLVSTLGQTLREAHLDGTAFFAVAHDSTRPYIVHSRAGVVRVLGTRFRMASLGNTVDLTVIEGRVSVTSGSDEVLIGAGESVEVRDDRPYAVVRPDDLRESFRWLGGFIAFQSTPLRDAAAELEARFGVSIRLGDPTVEDIRVTAWFAGADIEDVLVVLCRIANVRCSTRDGTTWIEQ